MVIPDGNEVVTYTYDGEFPDTLHSQKKGGNLVAGLTHNFRGQLTGIDRVGSGIEDTALTYHDQNENFQLRRLNHGATNDDIPDFHYEDYDALAQLRELNTLYSTGMAVSTFTYDGLGQMLTEQRSGDPSGVNYNYTYTYGAGGNIDKRKNENGGAVRNYVYDIDDTPNDGRHYHALESVTGDGLTATFINDPNGNMSSRTMGGVTYGQVFDVENRLASVTVNGQTTSFYYDPDGNRVLTIYGTGANQVKIYTPFPEYEKTVPATGSSTERIHYYVAGQYIATRVKVAGQAGAFYFVFTDRQGSVANMRKADGTWVNSSTARYDAFGGYRTKPATTVNPDISDRGYTGHRMNNTGNDLGLIYMNARYYLPEVGRFISADTIVPDPKDPQSYNRYSYALNSPTNYTDPSGHCIVAYSGDVRMNDGPYGTSGLCPNTESPITEGNAAIEAYYQQPLPNGTLPNQIRSHIFAIYNADAHGAGILLQLSLDTPIAGLELMAGRELIHTNANNSTTLFLVMGTGTRVGPSTSFINSLKGIVKSGNPVNASVAIYGSMVNNLENAVDDYSGPFKYRFTTVAAEAGVTWGETTSPPDIRGNRVTSEFIGPALGYALTTTYGTGVSIPIYTRFPGQLLPTVHWREAWQVIIQGRE